MTKAVSLPDLKSCVIARLDLAISTKKFLEFQKWDYPVKPDNDKEFLEFQKWDYPVKPDNDKEFLEFQAI